MLQSMVAFASLIAECASRKDRADPVLTYAGGIQRSGARMKRLLGDLVDIASIEAGVLAVEREVGDPTTAVTEAIETLQARASASGVSLTSETTAPPSSLAVFDPARIFQVLINLLSNAIKFTAPAGRAVVRVERIGDELRFAVSDTGVGIPADELDAVFDRFRRVRRTDRAGAGLGLYISRSIVRAHGGRIWAESRVGQGSTFYFTLPVYVAA